MTYVITTYGGGELFGLVFDGIAALFKEDRTGMIMPFIRVGLMVGLIYVVILMLFRSSLVEGMHWLLWVIVATNLLFLPKTRIHIHDPLNNYHRDVDHVPFALGAFAGFVSNIGKTVTEQFESNFSLPDYLPYHETGTVFASSLMSQLGKFRIVDPEFKGNMDRFVNQCVVYAVMIGNKYTITELQNTKDIWGLVKSKASPVLGFLYKEGSTPGKVETCKEGAAKLEKLWTAEIKRATALYGSRVQNRNITIEAFNTGLLGSARLLAGAQSWSESATDTLRQEMMIKTIEESSNNKLSELGSASNYAATKALLQQRSAYAIAGEIAARTLPLFKNVIEALSYALFIFIVVLALLPNGYRILITYFGILVWTQLWAPLYAILNLVMSLYGKAETLGHGAKNGLTLLNSSAIINANADMVTLAAWLSVSIPFISYGILKQGAGAFVGLAQHLGSAMQSAASGAAAETVSGNISLGNVSMGTQAYQNTTAFQHNTSPTYSASHFKAMDTSGMEQFTFADGTQSFNDQGMSNLPVKLMASVNHSYEEQQRLNEAQGVAHSKSVAAGKSIEAASQQFANVMERVGSDRFAGEQYHKNLTSNESKSLQNYNNLIKDLTENGTFTEAQAHEAAFMIKAGTPEVFGASVSASTSASGSTARQKAIGQAQSIADQKGYSYNLDAVLSASKALMEGGNDTKGAELAQSASASLNEATSLRDEAIVSHNKMKETSESYASSQRNDFQESRDVTPPFLEYVAHQPVNAGPTSGFGGEVGMNRAVAIMKEGGEEYQSYLQHFQKENPQYAIQRLNVSKEQQAIEQQYETGSTHLKGQSSVASQFEHNKQQILNRGNDLGLNPDVSPSQNLKNEIETMQKDAGIKIEGRKKEIKKDQEKLQEKVSVSQEQSLPGTTFKNAGHSLIGGSPLSLDITSSDKGSPPSESETREPVPNSQTPSKVLQSQKIGNKREQVPGSEVQQPRKEK